MSRLPTGFSCLDPFVDQWAIPGTNARALQRGSASDADRQLFFDIMCDQIDRALAYLDARPMDQFNAAEHNLMNLVLSFAHVALACEILRETEAAHTPHRNQLPITRSPAGA